MPRWLTIIPTFLTSVSFPREELQVHWVTGFLTFLSLLSPSSIHPSTLSPTSGLLMLELGVEIQLWWEIKPISPSFIPLWVWETM